MKYAVIDTNVIVSALISKNPQSPTVRILDAVMSDAITPLHSPEILAEYRNVLARKHFRFKQVAIENVINRFVDYGRPVQPAQSEEDFPDPSDKVFYCVALASQDDGAVLVTGNTRHYPRTPLVMTPAEFAESASI